MVSSVQDSMFQVITYRCNDITLDLPVKQKKKNLFLLLILETELKLLKQ